MKLIGRLAWGIALAAISSSVASADVIPRTEDLPSTPPLPAMYFTGGSVDEFVIVSAGPDLDGNIVFAGDSFEANGSISDSSIITEINASIPEPASLLTLGVGFIVLWSVRPRVRPR